MNLELFQTIKNPTISDCLELVKTEPIFYTRLPNYIRQDVSFNKQVLEDLESGWNAFQFMPHKTKELSSIAVKKHAINLKHVPEDVIDMELCEQAVKDKLWALVYIPDKFKTKALCWYALETSAESIEYIKNPDLKMCLYSVEKNYSNLRFIQKQDPEVCWLALRIEAISLGTIKNPTPEMCLYAISKNSSFYRLVKIVDNPNPEETIKNLNILKNQLLIKSTINSIDSN